MNINDYSLLFIIMNNHELLFMITHHHYWFFMGLMIINVYQLILVMINGD